MQQIKERRNSREGDRAQTQMVEAIYGHKHAAFHAFE